MREEDASLDNSEGPATSNPATPLSLHSEEDEVDSVHHEASEIDAEDEPGEQNSQTKEAPNEENGEDKNGSIRGNRDDGARVKDDPADDSEAELERGLDNIYLGSGKKDHKQPHIDNKPKIGAAKAKRQKRAEKMAALESEGKLPGKSSKSRKAIDPSAAMQKARGETATSGRRQARKK